MFDRHGASVYLGDAEDVSNEERQSMPQRCNLVPCVASPRDVGLLIVSASHNSETARSGRTTYFAKPMVLDYAAICCIHGVLGHICDSELSSLKTGRVARLSAKSNDKVGALPFRVFLRKVGLQCREWCKDCGAFKAGVIGISSPARAIAAYHSSVPRIAGRDGD